MLEKKERKKRITGDGNNSWKVKIGDEGMKEWIWKKERTY